MKSIPVYLALALAATQTAHSYVYCTFYEKPGCKGKHSASFSVDNDGCFRAAGRYFGCSGTFGSANFHMRQFPNNQDICGDPSHCNVIGYSSAGNNCHDLKKSGYNLRFSTYKIQLGSSCHASSATADNSTAEADSELAAEK